MNIFDLDFKPINKKGPSAYTRDKKRVLVSRTVSHGKECTTLSLSRSLMNAAGLRVGDRVLISLAETDQGVVVKINLDQINGYKLSPRDTTKPSRECCGKVMEAHTKSYYFNIIPEGEHSGAGLGVKQGEIYFITSAAQE